MEQTEEQKLSFQLILPTPSLPASLTHVTTTPASQFLVGYRNILVTEAEGVSWGLAKNSGSCGRAFVY